MISVVLAGGKGLRLWPESRQTCPKQLCKLVSDRSMLENTIDRLIQAGSNHLVIITSEDLRKDIQAIIDRQEETVRFDLLCEPEGKNTAPAVGMALAMFYPENKNDIMGIFPADHHIIDNTLFVRSLERAIQAAANNHLVTIGVTPKRPETGYGYIEKANYEFGEIPGVFPVSSFCEKPDLRTAELYCQDGRHIWNAGIYIGKIQVFLEEFANYLPEIYQYIINGYEKYREAYPYLPEISLDYGIAEKSKKIAVVPGDFGWCDLGSWNALSELYTPDEKSNTCSGNDIILLDSENCLVRQKEKTIVLYDVKDLLVIEASDLILVSNRNRSQDIKNIVENLEQLQRTDLL